jgi:site-specific recombinase XerD
MLHTRLEAATTSLVFANREGDRYLLTSVNHLQQKARTALKLPKDFVIHSPRHTMLTSLGESGVDAFTIMRIAGHSSITVSQRYVHPSPEAVERAFERLQLSGTDSRNEPRVLVPPTKLPTVGDAVAITD